MGGLTALLASTLAFANSVEAISLIGNYPTNDQAGNIITPSTSQKAVGFTLPTGTSYQLDNIVLRLFNYNTTTDTALLQIYADANKGSTSPNGPGTTLQSVVFSNPTSKTISTSRPLPPSPLPPIPAIGY